MVAAVVFDLDGVLVDSEPVWEVVRRQYVADHGGQWQPDTQRRLMGMSTGEWARYLSDELGVDRSAERVAVDVVAEMATRYEAAVPLVQGAVAVVRELARTWPLGLASSSPPRLIEAALSASGLADSFAVAMSSESVPNGKPAPDIYLAVAERLGQAPAACVAVEDSSNGVRSAAAAGMTVIAVPAGAYPLDRVSTGRRRSAAGRPGGRQPRRRDPAGGASSRSAGWSEPIALRVSISAVATRLGSEDPTRGGTEMKISSISGLTYRVRDLDTTVGFYESLGFRIGKRDDEQATCYVNWFWVRFVPDPDGAESESEALPTLYLKVDDIDDFYGAVVANGHLPSTEPRKGRTGGREFRLDDPDGNPLAFFAK